MRTAPRIAALITVAVAVTMASCSTDQAHRVIDQQIRVIDAVSAYRDQVDSVLADAELRGADAAAIVALLKASLPDAWDARLDDYLARGLDAIDAGRAISADLAATLLDTRDQLDALKAGLSDDPNADATSETIQSILIGFGGVGGIIAGIIGGVRRGRRQRTEQLVAAIDTARDKATDAATIAVPQLREAMIDAGLQSDVTRAIKAVRGAAAK